MTDFHSYAHSHFEHFKTYSKPEAFKKGRLLVRREEKNPWVFFIEKGYVKMMFCDEEGNERILGFGFPGMTIAQSGSFYALPHMALEYEAYSDCTIWKMPLDQFIKELQTNFMMFREWTDIVQKNQNMLAERVLYVGEKTPRTRIIAWLLAMARYYSITQDDGSILLEIPMTQDIMASFVHLGRESTNKVIRELKNTNLINIKNRYVIILDIQKLREQLYI